MNKYNSRDPMSYPRNTDWLHEYNQPINNLKIAYTEDFNLFPVDENVKGLFNEAIKVLRNAGYDVEPVSFNFKHTALDMAEQWCRGITIDCAIELNNLKKDRTDLLAKYKDDFPEEFIHYKNVCDRLTISDLYKFNLVRTDVLDQFENIFDKYDLILSPTLCVPGIKNTLDRNTKGPEEINGVKVEQLSGWTQTFLANFTGNPAASIPIGFIDRLPVGMQIIGKRHRDIDVLKLSSISEKLLPWINKYPY